MLTGETGTGKSIVVGAISAVLGGRIYAEIIRTGALKAIVEATFDIATLENIKKLLDDKGLFNENNELLLRREIVQKGNSRAFINDIPVTIKTLSEVGDLLIDIHGQSEHQSLLNKDTHRFFLDEFGQLQGLLNDLNAKFQRVCESEANLKNLQKRSDELNEKFELYQFQLEEIEKAQLINDEDKNLEDERKILNNTEKIFSLLSDFLQLVGGQDSTNLQESMGQALHQLRELSEFSDEFTNITEEFTSAKIVVEEAARHIEEFQNRIEYDPKRLEEIEQRLATISLLKKKYGNSIESVLAYRDKIKTELLLKENFDTEIENLQMIYRDSLEKYGESALKLSNARKLVAEKLEVDVIDHLKLIGMPKVRFLVYRNFLESDEGIFYHNNKRYHGDQFGVDQIEFFISTNPGEDFKPLVKIVSGGEISRIMLALKNILAEIDQIPLLVFDEIDSGISGQIASAVGRSIQKLANTHQIICITHLPQIATYGNPHFRVEKFVKDGRTFSRVNLLKDDDRVEEIASLIGGKKLSEEILESARQLLTEAGQMTSESI